MPPLHLALVPWLAAAPLILYLALGQIQPVPLERFAYDLTACLFFGAALSQLKSFPPLRQPVWPPVVIVSSALLTFAPSGTLALVLYAVGLMALSVVPTYWLARRVAVPWWAATLTVPPAVLFLHATHLYGKDPPPPAQLIEKVMVDVMWPFHLGQLPAPAQVGPNLIVISVDTLRADSARSMETWQRLAESGAHWQSAMSTSSWTMPALASLQTGLMPSDHGAGCLLDSHCQGMRDGVVTVAERLSEAGYATAAVSVNPWAGEGNGFARGFHLFRDVGNELPRRFLFARHAFKGGHPQDGGLAVDLALDAIDDMAGGSFYLWLHVIDPHLPYLNNPDPRMSALDVNNLRNAGVLSDTFRDEVRAAYQLEIDVLDTHLMRFLDGLQQRELLDESLLVFTSDHGEEFWEHGGVEHGHTHLREVIEVPLVVSGPGVRRGVRSGAASVLDVPHTLLHAAGVSTSGLDLRGTLPADRIAGAQGNLHHWLVCSARDRDTRVIIDGCESEDDRWMRAYDLQADPWEQRPVGVQPSNAVRQAAEAVVGPERHGESDQNTQALEALGYVD